MSKRDDREYDRKRREDVPTRRLYGTRAWQLLREEQLSREPICASCLREKRSVPNLANVVHHSEPHKGDVTKFWQGPFESLCDEHHNVDEQRRERGGRPRQILDDDGWPIGG